MWGPIEKKIRDRLVADFAPIHLEVNNESSQHSVPKGSESHFRVLVVSSRFIDLSRIARQRLVNDALSELLKTGAVHALTQRALTPAEWEQASSDSFKSPDCLHAPKK